MKYLLLKRICTLFSALCFLFFVCLPAFAASVPPVVKIDGTGKVHYFDPASPGEVSLKIKAVDFGDSREVSCTLLYNKEVLDWVK